MHFPEDMRNALSIALARRGFVEVCGGWIVIPSVYRRGVGLRQRACTMHFPEGVRDALSIALTRRGAVEGVAWGCA